MSETLFGIPCCDGVAVGSAVLQDEPRRVSVRYQMTADQLTGEMSRLENAFDIVDSLLNKLKRKLRTLPNKDPFMILEAHQSLLHDPSFKEAALTRVQRQRINAEWALEQTVSEIRGVFDSIEDTYIRSRMEDIVSLRDQLLDALQDPDGAATGKRTAMTGAILVARDLAPDATIRAIRGGIVGILAQDSSPNTHAAIIARAMGIPMICAIPDLTSKIRSGEQVVVDGTEGLIVVAPDVVTLGAYKKKQLESIAQTDELWGLSKEPATLLDQTPILVQANVDIPDEIADERIEIVDGIGLFRTEIPFLFDDEPSEQDLVAQYQMIIEMANGKPVVFRLFDLGADKIPWYRKNSRKPETNPALGLRGIRFLLQNEKLLHRQVRAILQAAASQKKISILVPMVTRISDMQRCRTIIFREAEALGVERERVSIGAMIETPAAALQLHMLQKECDYFSIGSNDLIQYLLAVDRGNEAVAEAFDPAHPAVIRMLQMIVDDAGKIPVTLCGEMGGNGYFLPLLIGLGLRSFSMPVRSVPKAKAILAKLSVKECRALAGRSLDAATGAEVRALLDVFNKTILG